jgi:uncharacterized protein (TIGR01777 family)
MPARPRIVLTGATGLVGRALTKALTAQGYEVAPLRSRTQGPGGMDIASSWLDRDVLEGAHAVIHLAGEPIAQRWTAAAKERILSSRAKSTRLLAEKLAHAADFELGDPSKASLPLRYPPKIFLSMSGINRYGIHRRGETLTESSAVSDEGFLGKVSAAWEEATNIPGTAHPNGLRTVHLRTGMVLAASGGALKAMLPAFKAGLGGRVGTGRQQVSWIRLGDLVSLIIWALENPAVEGPLNAVAPHPVSQADFARTLGQVLHRPAVIPAPAWAVKLLFGQMGAETLLADLAVAPRKALDGGFIWSTPDLPAALTAALRE